jgi:hypothetical protein
VTEQVFTVVVVPAEMQPPITSATIARVLARAFGGWPTFTVTEESRTG